MKSDDLLVAVSVCIRGVELNPHVLSDTLGVHASRLQRKGDIRRTSTGKNVVAKIGLWELGSGLESRDISEHINLLAMKLAGRADLIRSIDEVSEAYVDIFIAKKTGIDGEGTVEFDMNKACIDKLYAIGLPARFEIAVVRD